MIDAGEVSYAINKLITDRTVWDVSEETEKGFYRIEDLNRVENAVKALAEYMNINGYPVHVSPLQGEWTFSTSGGYPRLQEDAARYLGNIRAIRNATPAGMFPDMPEVPPNMDMLTYREANDIESILRKTFLYIVEHER